LVNDSTIPALNNQKAKKKYGAQCIEPPSAALQPDKLEPLRLKLTLCHPNHCCRSADTTAEPWVFVDQIAEHLGVARDSIYRWIGRKGLPAHRVWRLWKFQASEVDDWVRVGGADETQKNSIGKQA